MLAAIRELAVIGENTPVEYMEGEETTPIQKEKVYKVVTQSVVSVRTSLTSRLPVVSLKGGGGVAIMQQRREKSITASV